MNDEVSTHRATPLSSRMCEPRHVLNNEVLYIGACLSPCPGPLHVCVPLYIRFLFMFICP